MKAIISTTYDDLYLFYLPITTWAWNKLGVDVICFMPDNPGNLKTAHKLMRALDMLPDFGNNEWHHGFKSPTNKEATYAHVHDYTQRQ